MRHLPYIAQGIHAIVQFIPFHCLLCSVQLRFVGTWPLVQTLNLDLANLTPLFPNYSCIITTPIIPKEIPE